MIIRFVLRSCHGDGFRPTIGSFGREAARHGAGPRSPTMTSSRTPSTPRDRWALVEGSVALTARALARQQAALVAAAAAAGAGRAAPGRRSPSRMRSRSPWCPWPTRPPPRPRQARLTGTYPQRSGADGERKIDSRRSGFRLVELSWSVPHFAGRRRVLIISRGVRR